ncbi:unnamed protein product [Clavelina lepadiformis]|uniref:DENN domain-containing protein 11 n=1 Tax=Clavelina lepadiformis TaxID=159417 RepID=A0ABP0G2D2_CLALP
MDHDESQPLLLDDRDNDADNSASFLSIANRNHHSKHSILDNSAKQIDFSNIFEKDQLESEPDVVMTVFVVAFDTHHGNIVEWSVPNDAELKSVEFQAMPSGAHKVDSDFIYFRIKDMFGLSCFEKMRVDSIEERGARMKSVGIISPSYTTLFKHMQFLELQVRHQLQTPGRYEQLLEFYKDRCGVLPPLCNQPSSDFIIRRNQHHVRFPQMKITHPAGCFSQFVQFFGENIFVLWKLMLLQKRILFFSPPPIGVVCYRVYCACCLGRVTLAGFNNKCAVPYFYVNIADIDQLESEMTYVACTTEKIFQEKKDLYDVYVDNQLVQVVDNRYLNLLCVTKVDRENYQNLQNHRKDLFHQKGLGNSELPSEEQFYQSFFTLQNNQLFRTLIETSTSPDRTLTEEHIRAMGLDPVGDRHFIMDLLELYAIDVMLVADNPCCPV